MLFFLLTKGSGGGVYCKHRVNKYGVIAVKKEVKKRLKRNYKLVLGIIIGGIISGVGAYAATTISSSNISYDNSKSGLTSTNLNGAIDELYEKVNSKPCNVINGTGTQTSDEIKCGTEEFYVLYSSGDSVTVLTKYPIEGGAAEVATRVDTIFGIDYYEKRAIENPSYAQNKACGAEIFVCGGVDFLSKYKETLNKIGLSSDIEVMNPSLSELNKAGCQFNIPPMYENVGSCKVLPWLEKVVVTDIISGGPNTQGIVGSQFDSYLPQAGHNILSVPQKLIVKISARNIKM